MEDLQVSPSGGSSPLSSLNSSPEPETRPSKRPRLSSSPPSHHPLFLAQHRSPPELVPVEEQHEDIHALLDGLSQEFDLPPSSDPVMRRQDEGDSDSEMDQSGCRTITYVDGAEGGERAEGNDSGIGLLPLDDKEGHRSIDSEAQRERSVEPPDKVAESNDEEFEGDDMWLGFDDADMGFDQPDAFPSSIIPVNPLAGDASPRIQISEGEAKNGGAKEDEATDEAEQDLDEYSKPVDLASFGFSTFNSGSDGFSFAVRKSFVPSAAALQAAQARMQNYDSPADDEKLATDPFGVIADARPTRPGTSDSTARIEANVPSRMDPSSRPFFVRPDPSTHKVPRFLASVPQQTSTDSLVSDQRQNLLARSKISFDSDATFTDPERCHPSSSPGRILATATDIHPALPSRIPPHDHGTTSLDPFESGPEAVEPRAYSLQPLALPEEPISHRPENRSNPFDSPTISRTRSFHHVGDLDADVPNDGKRSPLLAVENLAVLPPDDDMRSENGASTTTLTSSSPQKRDVSPLPASEARPPLSSTPASDMPSTVFAVPRPPTPASRPITGVCTSEKLGDSTRTNGTNDTPNPPRRPSAFRSPMINSARLASQAQSSTPLHLSRLKTASTAFPVASTSSATLIFNRRLNVGMTPRNKPFHLANSQSSGNGKGQSRGFVTPFKGGKRPDGLTPMGLKDKMGTPAASEAAKPSSVVASKAQTRVNQLGGGGNAKAVRAKIFELDPTGPPRSSLFDYGMRPQTHLFEELETLGISCEILSMNSVTSKKFVFPCGRSARDAFDSLKELVAARSPDEKDLVTLPWIENHWTLIVWKLASYVRTKPELIEQWWTFETVLNQLRYRYEREINRAQRSAIKRIQERDSPAALPMVLCVSQLLWDDPDESVDEPGATQVIVGVELTDGWYRIRATVDPTLRSACERGKLIVGSKLAITGARLDKVKSEGMDPIEALTRSKLIITGNLTSLAPWDATLGFSRTQFFASLDSLSSAGGSIAPLDIVVEKIFELGYVDATSVNSGTWGEAEEREKAEEWEKGRQRIHNRLSDAAEKDGVEEDDLVVLLQEAVQGSYEDERPANEGQDAEAEDPEEIIDRLGSASNKRAILRKVARRTLQACLAHATERASQSRTQSYYEMTLELDQKYPPRQIRSVRMMRVKDALEGANGPFERNAIITVWDVKDHASDFFQEGKRYQVTNTVVKGTWQRKHKEITLHTKKESRWTKVEAR